MLLEVKLKVIADTYCMLYFCLLKGRKSREYLRRPQTASACSSLRPINVPAETSVSPEKTENTLTHKHMGCLLCNVPEQAHMKTQMKWCTVLMMDSRNGEWMGLWARARARAHTDLLSLPCSFFSPPLSHLRRRKRLRWGEALGVEQLDHTASSSLDGVISMDGSCRYSLEPELWRCSCSFSLMTFFIRRILKRLRRRDELDRAGSTTDPLHSPSAGPWICSAGSWRVSNMVLLLFSLTWVQNQIKIQIRELSESTPGLSWVQHFLCRDGSVRTYFRTVLQEVSFKKPLSRKPG